MTTITAPVRHSPRTVRTFSAPAWRRARRVLHNLHSMTADMNADHRSPLCDLALRPYSEARSAR